MSFADDFDSYSPTSRPLDDPDLHLHRESFSIDHSVLHRSTNHQPATSFTTLCQKYLRLYSVLLTVQAVTCFAAIHFNRDLKHLISPSDDHHSNVAGASFLLFLLAYGITQHLVRRCRTSISWVWILGSVMGHIMGFAFKQVYVALVRQSVNSKQVVALTSVWISIPLLLLISFVTRWMLTHCADRYQKRRASIRVKRCNCCGSKPLVTPRSRASNELLSQRRLTVVVREAVDDAFAVALGFSIYAACYGTATLQKPYVLSGIFKVEEGCFNVNLASNTTTNTEEQETSTEETGFLFVYLIMLIILPICFYHCQNTASTKKITHCNNATCQKVSASLLRVLGISMSYALGFATYHVLSGPLELAGESGNLSNNEMLVLVGIFCCLAMGISVATHAASEAERTIRERRGATAVLAGLELPTSSVCVRCCGLWRVKMWIPAITLMFIVFVGLSFESFFQCVQHQLVELLQLQSSGKNSIELVFTLLSVLGILGVASCCGQTFSDHHEQELIELVEDEKSRSNSLVEESVQSHEELLLGSGDLFHHDVS